MATRKANITKSIIDKLEPGEIVWDTRLSGFGVRCQKKAKVFVVKKYYRGKQRWHTLGTPSEAMTVAKARKKAETLLGQTGAKYPVFPGQCRF